MTEPNVNAKLTRDHVGLDDTFAARRYFRKFDRIVDHLNKVADEMRAERSLSKTDVKVIGGYISALDRTFQALSMKYLMTGRETGSKFGSMSFDAQESGFPVFRELMTMANDAQQAERHLRGMMSESELKNEMVRSHRWQARNTNQAAIRAVAAAVLSGAGQGADVLGAK